MCYLEAGLRTHWVASDKDLCQDARGRDTSLLVRGESKRASGLSGSAPSMPRRLDIGTRSG